MVSNYFTNLINVAYRQRKTLSIGVALGLTFLMVYEIETRNHVAAAMSYYEKLFKKEIVQELCPLEPPNLKGKLSIITEKSELSSMERLFPYLEEGGRYRPSTCVSRHRVAIVVPYRDRPEHLRVFLRNLHPLLQRQQLDYGLYITEQVGNETFNRGLIKNIGFSEAVKDYDYDCVIFHDVDLIPEDDRNPYTCVDSPRHLSRAIDIFKYKIPRSLKNLFGGVVSMSREQFETVNGYSNQFWGWGAEDNDLYERLTLQGLKFVRYSAEVARYKMLKHTKDRPNPNRYKILKSVKRRWKRDGLNNIELFFSDARVIRHKLYTLIRADVRQPTTDYD